MVFQMGIKDVCTPEAPNRFTCPITHSFFTASVMWGTIGPRKTFGAGAPYQWLLMGFPIGAGVVLIFWGLKKMFPKVRFLRQVHIVAVFYGGVYWGIYSTSPLPSRSLFNRGMLTASRLLLPLACRACRLVFLALHPLSLPWLLVQVQLRPVCCLLRRNRALRRTAVLFRAVDGHECCVVGKHRDLSGLRGAADLLVEVFT